MPKTMPNPVRAPLVQQNILDKAIAYAMPGLAMRRMAQRSQLALAGGYTGGKIDRAQLSRWMPTAADANADSVRELRRVTQWSEHRQYGLPSLWVNCQPSATRTASRSSSG